MFLYLGTRSLTNINLPQFEATIWARHNTIEISLENVDLGLKGANMKIIEKNTIKPNNCNQCDFASLHASNLRRHLKTHNVEKSIECKQCGYASFRADQLRTHSNTHSGEKSNKCNQCDYASSYAGNLRAHLKTHSGEKSNKCNQPSSWSSP